MVSIREALVSAALPGESGRLEAELLLCHCIGESRSFLYTWPERAVEPGHLNAFQDLLDARRRGEPLAYLTGRREFWSLELEVDSQTLIPRPETETLVEWALSLPLGSSAVAADWGTGSGAIALALASERPGWTVIASDFSGGALTVAARNRGRLGLGNVQLVQSNWGDALSGGFDLIVSNPPYVAQGDPHLEQGDLRFEPDSALVAGTDGLSDIRHIVVAASKGLVPGGWLLLEHGLDQGAAVRALLQDAGFVGVATRADLGGRERISGGQRP